MTSSMQLDEDAALWAVLQKEGPWGSDEQAEFDRWLASHRSGRDARARQRNCRR